MTIQAAYQELTQQLLSLYENGESAAIADLVIEHLTSTNKNEKLLRKEKMLSLNLETADFVRGLGSKADVAHYGNLCLNYAGCYLKALIKPL